MGAYLSFARTNFVEPRRDKHMSKRILRIYLGFLSPVFASLKPWELLCLLLQSQWLWYTELNRKIAKSPSHVRK